MKTGIKIGVNRKIFVKAQDCKIQVQDNTRQGLAYCVVDYFVIVDLHLQVSEAGEAR